MELSGNIKMIPCEYNFCGAQYRVSEGTDQPYCGFQCEERDAKRDPEKRRKFMHRHHHMVTWKRDFIERLEAGERYI